MITYKIGDIVEAIKNGDLRAVGHQTNCFNTMGSGVAKALRTAFPQVYDADCKTDRGDINKLGSITYVDNDKYNCTIYNLYGQYQYGKDGAQYTNYMMLKSSLYEMKRDMMGWCWTDVVEDDFVGHCIYEEDVNIGFPKIGAGLGGGDWDIISSIIEEVFCEDFFKITVYTLE